MKKIISLFIISFAMVILSITACAATPSVTEGADAVTVKNISNDDFAISAVYNDNLILTGVQIFKNTNEISINYKIDIFDKYDDADYLKLFVWSKNQEPRMTAYGIDLPKYNKYFIPDITLNSGYTMPVLGLGTWTQNDETTANSVYHALKDGYRLIDTAQYYGNETGVGEGVRKAIDEGIVTRDEL